MTFNSLDWILRFNTISFRGEPTLQTLAKHEVTEEHLSIYKYQISIQLFINYKLCHSQRISPFWIARVPFHTLIVSLCKKVIIYSALFYLIKIISPFHDAFVFYCAQRIFPTTN